MDDNHGELRVLHILEATAGGARKHLRYVLCGLRDRGLAIDVIASPARADPEWEDDLQCYQEAGIEVFKVPMARRPALLDLKAYWAIKRIIRLRSPHLVHTHCAKAGLLGRLAAQAAGDSIVTVHTPHAFFYEGFNGAAARRLGVALERFLGKRTNLLVCVSRAEKERALDDRLIMPSRVRVATNGLPANFAAGLKERAAVRQQFDIPESAFTIGVFARLVEQKGHEQLFHAIARLSADERQRLCVTCLGDGPQRPHLEQLRSQLGLDDCLRMPGHMPAAELYLRGLDLAIVPSLYEGLSYHLLEALAAGLPVIATEVPGNLFEFEDNPVFYVPLRDPESLAAAISEFLRNDGERNRRAWKGPKWIATHFPLEKQIQTLHAAYQQLVVVSGDTFVEG